MAWSKESRQSRGYGSVWDRRRQRVIERAKGLCEECMRNGRVTPGRDVDHKVSRAKAKIMGWSEIKTESMDNLQYLCVPCHKRKTAEETGATYREPRLATGLDGWPEEK